MQRALCFLFVVCSIVHLRAAHGLVYSTGGQKLEGEISFVHGGLVIRTPDGRSITVASTNLSRAQVIDHSVPIPSQGGGNGLFGIYYGSTNFSGRTVMRIDEAVDFDWRMDVPIPGVPAEAFSVRWMGSLEAPTTEAYQIHFGSDDGARLFVDDQLRFENWKSRQYAETNVTVNLKAGEKKRIRIEYANFSGSSRVRLGWSTATMPPRAIPQNRLFTASSDTQHRAGGAGLAGTQGLLATYYNSGDFSSNSFTRVDSEINFDWEGMAPADGIDGNCFSVRWSGNLLVTNSGDYQFYLLGGLPARLFVNDRLLSAPADLAPQQIISTALRAGERCSFRLELQVTNNQSPVRLYWSSEHFTQTLLSRLNLSPTVENAPELATDTSPELPAGVVLTSGVIVSAPIQSASDTTLRFQGLLNKSALPLTKVARIHVKPLSAELIAALPKGRAGVLLKNRDFIDGDFAGIENGRITIASVLFGRRSYDLAKDVMAVVLRGNEPVPWRFSMTARDGSALYGRSLSIEATGLSMEDAPDFFIPPPQVIEIVRRHKGARR